MRSKSEDLIWRGLFFPQLYFSITMLNINEICVFQVLSIINFGYSLHQLEWQPWSTWIAPVITLGNTGQGRLGLPIPLLNNALAKHSMGHITEFDPVFNIPTYNTQRSIRSKYFYNKYGFQRKKSHRWIWAIIFYLFIILSIYTSGIYNLI